MYEAGKKFYHVITFWGNNDISFYSSLRRSPRHMRTSLLHQDNQKLSKVWGKRRLKSVDSLFKEMKHTFYIFSVKITQHTMTDPLCSRTLSGVFNNSRQQEANSRGRRVLKRVGLRSLRKRQVIQNIVA